MPHGSNPQRDVNRIERLRRRLRVISKYPSVKQLGEISALEWAIPILEYHIKKKYKTIPAFRTLLYKHERSLIVQNLLRRDGTICYLCGLEMGLEDMTIDHVVPLSKGGRDGMINYKITHELCNLEKGNMTEGEYRKQKEKDVST